jgi:NADPH-dependent 2,4-dienoyl-CoA reductase/sulfur reductase-like enzyme
MEQIIEHSRKTIITERPDVLVVGAGPAGIGAAIASARNGAKTMLIEQSGYVGGNLTIAEINPMFTFHDINGKQIINGITEEFILEMV